MGFGAVYGHESHSSRLALGLTPPLGGVWSVQFWKNYLTILYKHTLMTAPIARPRAFLAKQQRNANKSTTKKGFILRGLCGEQPQTASADKPIYIQHKKHTLGDFLPLDFFVNLNSKTHFSRLLQTPKGGRKRRKQMMPKCNVLLQHTGNMPLNLKRGQTQGEPQRIRRCHTHKKRTNRGRLPAWGHLGRMRAQIVRWGFAWQSPWWPWGIIGGCWGLSGCPLKCAPTPYARAEPGGCARCWPPRIKALNAVAVSHCCSSPGPQERQRRFN